MNASSRPLHQVSALMLAALTLAYPSPAQDRPARPEDSYPIKYFHLANTSTPNEANEIMVAIRNIVSPNTVKVYLVPSDNEIVISGPPDQLARAGEIVAEFDHPKKAYRLTFTLNESDNGKRLGVQHFSFVAVAGQRVQLKQGDKVPVVTGSFNTDQNAQQNQVTYLDVGMNIDVTLSEVGRELNMKSIVEQSSVAPESPGSKLPDDPIVRQSKLEGTSALPLGKSLTLGALDIVGSTRHIDIEVLAEPLP